MQGIFLHSVGHFDVLPAGVKWTTRTYSDDPKEFHHGLCGSEADVVISDVKLSVPCVRYLLTRLRNPRNPDFPEDIAEMYICMWRLPVGVNIRIGEDVFHVTRESWSALRPWLEDRLEDD